MKERPILFNAEMMNAILEGRKTMTRRVINPQPTHFHYFDNGQEPCDIKGNSTKCPYGQPGDRLWVRETWTTTDPIWDGDKAESFMVPAIVRGKEFFYYRADGEQKRMWRPSIYMPRWASRITLEVTSIMVEQVQNITDSDAKSEGVSYQYPGQSEATYKDYQLRTLNGCETAKESFMTLWDSINEKRGYGWNANPWVWVVEFKTV